MAPTRLRPIATVVLACLIACGLAPGGTTPSSAGYSLNIPPMRDYVLGLLRKGPSWTAERTARTDSLQAGHMANMKVMWEQGKLVAAGPVAATDDLRGIWVFRADSAAEVRDGAAQDPAVRAGRLQVDLMTWHAPIGIGDGYRDRLGRPGVNADSMVTRWLVMLKRGPKWVGPAGDAETSGKRSPLVDPLAGGQAPAAGPVRGSDELEALAIFATDSLAAWTAANSDPAVRAGRLRVEMARLWFAYGNLPGER